MATLRGSKEEEQPYTERTVHTYYPVTPLYVSAQPGAGRWKTLEDVMLYRNFPTASVLETERPRYYDIRDLRQMVWVLCGDVLITAPSSSNTEPVTLEVIACRCPELRDKERGNWVYLGIKNKNLSLRCTETEGKPTLQLEEIYIMELYWKKIPQESYLFVHSMEGSTSTFESLIYPDWFIATSSVPGEPVFLTQNRGFTSNTNFYLDPKDYISSGIFVPCSSRNG
ncbi:interleukin-36 beta-like [Octodon degus]|uniref:Interleukin-1 n=1 Tax=Octodon degus TaxID=10160 RepID=A0A6P3VBP0_OCTDE|nr:interleukin-36 beta-like [Octodon degus]